MRIGLIVVLFACLSLGVVNAQDGGEWGMIFFSEYNDEPGLYWMSLAMRKVELVFPQRIRLEQYGLGGGREAISPDGSKIAFDSAEPTSPLTAIYTIDLATHRLTQVTSPQRLGFYHVEWSPDGKLLAYCSSSTPSADAVHILDLDTGEEDTILQETDLFNSLRAYIDFCVRWSPDGEKLFLTAGTYPVNVDYVDVVPYRAIYSMRVDGSDLKRITPEGFNAIAPTFAAIPEVMYYLGSQENGLDWLGNNQIWKMDLNSGDSELVINLANFGFYPKTVETDQAVTFEGILITDLHASPQGLFLLDTYTFETNTTESRSDIYLVDPIENTVTNLTRGLSNNNTYGRWFYRQEGN